MSLLDRLLRRPPPLPVSDDERVWVDTTFDWFATAFPQWRIAERPVILPTAAFFPGDFDTETEHLSLEEKAQRVLERVCGYIDLDPARITLTLFPDHDAELRKTVPVRRNPEEKPDPAGLYYGARGEDDTFAIALKESVVRDPVILIAVLAHELSHVLLLGESRMARDEFDMEQRTDLLTVYLGFGIFNANCVNMYFQNAGRWRANRMGYLAQTQFGYALAAFAHRRGEGARPPWLRYLTLNVRTYARAAGRRLAWEEKQAKGGAGQQGDT